MPVVDARGRVIGSPLEKEQAPKSKVISYDRIKDIIENIPSLRTRAIVATQYALAARIGELIVYRHPSLGFETQGLLKQNIEYHEKSKVFTCTIPNFKNKKQPFKKPFISVTEKFVFEPFARWYKQTGEQVFPLKFSRIRQLISEALPSGFSTHALRHSRATHLAEQFNFNAYEIKAFLGHARLDTSAIYVTQDLTRSANKLKEGLI